MKNSKCKTLILSIGLFFIFHLIGCIPENNGAGNYRSPQDYFEMGIHYYQKGEYERAEGQLLKAIQLQPDFAEAYNQLGYTCYGLYEVHFKKEKDMAKQYYYKSINSFKAAVRYKSDYADPYIGLAILQILAKQFDEAIAFLKKAQEVEPHNFNTTVQTHYQLGRCYTYKEEYQKAIEEFEEYLRLMPSGPGSDAVQRSIMELRKHLNSPKNN
ncbi:MAG: tetratricopeptide repeat protein [Planctomycetota bacterium]